ncbi:DUF1985 domain-containing protein [Raphanus sativus]|nr:DUF1985 domain-containing protein [Raphanus sativus]
MAKPKAKKKLRPSQETDPPSQEPETQTQGFSGGLLPDTRLPPRLFATDWFPTNRLNIYSSPEILHFLCRVLRGSCVFQTIRESSFRKLFDIPARQCPDVDLEEKENVDVDVEKNAGVDDAATETYELPPTQSPKKKKKTHRRHTSFNTLRARCKKSGTSNQSESEQDVDLEEKGNVDVDVEKSACVDDAAMETDELPQTQSPNEQYVPDTDHHSVEPEHAAPLDEDPPTDKYVDAMETDRHQEPQSPIISQYVAHLHRHASQLLITHSQAATVHTTSVHDSGVHSSQTPKTEEKIETTPPRGGKRPGTKSVIYDKADHPDSPEIKHLLFHGVRIYDPESPKTPPSNPPILTPQLVHPLRQGRV